MGERGSARGQRRRLGIALVLAGLVFGSWHAGARAQGDPACPPGQPPPFGPGLAPLADQLGSIIGRPVECAHRSPENQDVLQQTSTGLAYVRAQTATPIFTDGARHWALTPDGVRCWTGASVDPPSTFELTRLPTTSQGGAPDPWVAGESLPARISSAPFDVGAGDVVAALKERCLPIVGDLPVRGRGGGLAPGQGDGALSTATFRAARLPAWPGGCGRS